MRKTRSILTLVGAVVGALSVTPIHAQEGSFALDLNNVTDVEAGCRLTYVATNNSGVSMDKTSYEVAVFDQEGIVSRLLILEFGQVQDGRTKVVQFDLADQPCTDISRLLVNSVAECVATDGSTPNCMESLQTSSRGTIQFGT
ncbi:MAG: hypothetical protein AAFQ66_21265 [Pseudomonadota bacterium]